MNKNDKGSIIFILLIPIFLIISLVVIDTLINYTVEKNYKRVTENIIKDIITDEEIYYDEYYEKIKKLYELEGYETEMLIVDANEYDFYLENEHKYHGLFSSLFGVGEVENVKLFGILDFRMKKASKTIIKLNITIDEEENIQFEYVTE